MTKTEKTIQLANRNISEIKVERINMDKLRQKTLDSKQDWFDFQADLRQDWDRYYTAYEADEETIERWMVNYVRHRLTRYEDTLDGYAGKTGKQDAYLLYSTAVLEKIAEVYPELADECRRQAEAKAYVQYAC